MNEPSSTRTETTEALNQRRRRAVEMRLAGASLPVIREETGLSAPTVISAWKAFVAGGWSAVPVKSLGRQVGQGRRLKPDQERELKDAIFKGSPADQSLPDRLWSVDAVKALLRTRFNLKLADSTVLRYLGSWGLDLTPLRSVRPANADESRWLADELPRHLNRARARRARIVRAGQLNADDGFPRLLCGTSLRGRPVWLPLTDANQAGDYVEFLAALLADSTVPLWVLLHGVDTEKYTALAGWIAGQGDRLTIIACPISLGRAAESGVSHPTTSGPAAEKPARPAPIQPAPPRETSMTLTHLQRLEAEAIHILREVVAEAEKPVMLYSVGR